MRVPPWRQETKCHGSFRLWNNLSQQNASQMLKCFKFRWGQTTPSILPTFHIYDSINVFCPLNLEKSVPAFTAIQIATYNLTQKWISLKNYNCKNGSKHIYYCFFYECLVQSCFNYSMFDWPKDTIINCIIKDGNK